MAANVLDKIKVINELTYAHDAALVTPHDTNDLTNFGKLWVGTGGDIKVDTYGGSTATYINVPNGTYLTCYVKRVYSTGTTASNIIVEY